MKVVLVRKNANGEVFVFRNRMSAKFKTRCSIGAPTVGLNERVQLHYGGKMISVLTFLGKDGEKARRPSRRSWSTRAIGHPADGKHVESGRFSKNEPVDVGIKHCSRWKDTITHCTVYTQWVS